MAISSPLQGHTALVAAALADAVDEQFYATVYGPLDEDITAAEHYATVGWREGRDPNPWFSTSAYLNANPDVAAANLVPLFHYLEKGAKEGRVIAQSTSAMHFYVSATQRSGDSGLGRETRQAARRMERMALENPIVRSLFSPSMYAKAAGLEATDPGWLWQHFLENGATDGVFPSPLFDAQFYAANLARNRLPAMVSADSPIVHWLEVGMHARIVPTPRFDEAFYRRLYPDIDIPEYFGFCHFVQYGLAEKRQPTYWFDPWWYAAQIPETSSEEPAYFDFLCRGVDEGRFPCAQLAKFARWRQCRLRLELYDELAEATRTLSATYSLDVLRLLLDLYVPEAHKDARHLHPIAALIEFLRNGISAGTTPGPLFDVHDYAVRVTAAQLPLLAADQNPVLHWLEHGIPSRVVPTPRFDEEYYRKEYPDIGNSEMWGFAHFASHGIYEGRRPRQDQGLITRPQLPLRGGIPVLPPLYRQWIVEDNGSSYRVDSSVANEDMAAARIEARLSELMRSEGFRAMVGQAQELAPDMCDVQAITNVWVPSISEPLAIMHAEVHARIPHDQYETVICMPFMRMGGADFVASLFAKAMLRVHPKGRVLILRTDSAVIEHSHWFPADADIVDISDINKSLDPASAERLLQAVLFGLSPKRVVNINSHLCWRVFRRFGNRLSPSMSLYACIFCWDYLPNGLRVGYGSTEWFAESFNHLRAVITDNSQFRDELLRIYAIPQPLRDKLVALRMPSRCEIRTPSIARLAATREPRAEKRVFWAGRLDRQKRFFLVEDIARLMPDVKFHCWGKATLDGNQISVAPPANLTLHAPYSDHSELPTSDADAWLLTSAWEGLPNTLIEAAALGFPIVATAVGGVPDLITEETGWSVSVDAPAEAYVEALRNIFANPEKAVARAERLQSIVGDLHTEQRFDDGIGELIEGEEEP